MSENNSIENVAVKQEDKDEQQEIVRDTAAAQQSSPQITHVQSAPQAPVASQNGVGNQASGDRPVLQPPSNSNPVPPQAEKMLSGAPAVGLGGPFLPQASMAQAMQRGIPTISSCFPQQSMLGPMNFLPQMMPGAAHMHGGNMMTISAQQALSQLLPLPLHVPPPPPPPGYQLFYCYLPIQQPVFQQGAMSVSMSAFEKQQQQRQQKPQPILAPTPAPLMPLAPLTPLEPAVSKQKSMMSPKPRESRKEAETVAEIAGKLLQLRPAVQDPTEHAALDQPNVSETESMIETIPLLPAKGEETESNSLQSGVPLDTTAESLQKLANEGVELELAEYKSKNAWRPWTADTTLLYIHKQHYKLRFKTKRAAEGNRAILENIKTKLKLRLMHKQPNQSAEEWQELTAVANRLHSKGSQQSYRDAITSTIMPIDTDKNNIYIHFSIFASSHQHNSAIFCIQMVVQADDTKQDIVVHQTHPFTTLKKQAYAIEAERMQKKRGITAVSAAAAQLVAEEGGESSGESDDGNKNSPTSGARADQRNNQLSAGSSSEMEFDPLAQMAALAAQLELRPNEEAAASTSAVVVAQPAAKRRRIAKQY